MDPTKTAATRPKTSRGTKTQGAGNVKAPSRTRMKVASTADIAAGLGFADISSRSSSSKSSSIAGGSVT